MNAPRRALVSPPMCFRRVVVLALATSLLGSCASESDVMGGSETPSPRPSTVGDLVIVEPQPGALFDGASVPVTLTLGGATIVAAASTNITPDTGHIHVTLDDKVLSLLSGLEFDLVDLTEESIEPGTHLLRVEFVAADHGPFSPREVEVATFTVRG